MHLRQAGDVAIFCQSLGRPPGLPLWPGLHDDELAFRRPLAFRIAKIGIG